MTTTINNWFFHFIFFRTDDQYRYFLISPGTRPSIRHFLVSSWTGGGNINLPSMTQGKGYVGGSRNTRCNECNGEVYNSYTACRACSAGRRAGNPWGQCSQCPAVSELGWHFPSPKCVGNRILIILTFFFYVLLLFELPGPIPRFQFVHFVRLHVLSFREIFRECRCRIVYNMPFR